MFDSEIPETEKSEECDSCGYKTEGLKFYASQRIDRPNQPGKWLCVLCASTVAGNALDYPEFYPDHNSLKTICYVGNVILARLDEIERRCQVRE